MPWRRIWSIFGLVLFLLLQTPALVRSQPPTPTPSPTAAAAPTATPDAQTLLNRANDVAALAREAAQQNTTTIATVQFLAWAFGIIVGIATVVLALYGFSTQRGFQETMNESKRDLQETLRDYKAQLDQAQIAAEKAFQSEQSRVQELQSEMQQSLHEIAATRQELRQIKESVRQEFSDAKAALVLLEFGNRLFNDGKLEYAIATYEQARRHQPEDADITYRLGRAYSNRGRYDDAIEALEQALNNRPTFAEAQMELGLAYRRRAEQKPSAEDRAVEYRLAERYLKRAITLRPDYEDALGALGGLYRREQRYSDALVYYQRAADVDPASSYAIGNIASLSWYLGHERARYYFERVAEVAQKRIRDGREQIFWPLYDLALAQLVLGQRAEAIDTLEMAIAQTPSGEHVKSVLDNLHFVARSPLPVEGLDEFIKKIEAAFPQR